MTIVQSKSGIAYLTLIVFVGVFYSALSAHDGVGVVGSTFLASSIIVAGALIYELSQALRTGRLAAWQSVTFTLLIVACWYVLHVVFNPTSGVIDPQPRHWSFWLLPSGAIVWCVFQIVKNRAKHAT